MAPQGDPSSSADASLPASLDAAMRVTMESAMAEALAAVTTPASLADDGNDRKRMLDTVLPYVLIVGFIMLITMGFLAFSIFMTRRAARSLAAQVAEGETARTDTNLSRINNLAVLVPVKTFVSKNPTSASAESGREEADDSVPANDDETCPICLDQFNTDDSVRDLPCHHMFHQQCIDPWFLQRKYTCPICKRIYFSAEQE